MANHGTVEIAGVEVTVVPDEGLRERMIAERGIVGCVGADETTPFDDNLLGTCLVCERGVQYRPSMPEGVARVCLRCVTTVPNDVLQGKVDAFYDRTRR